MVRPTDTLKDLAQETLRFFVENSETNYATGETVFHESGSVSFISQSDGVAQPIIAVEYGDTLQVTRKYLKENPCVLNMASKHTPGGGWLRGATAQEEMLCYRSGLYLSLSHFISRYPLADYDAIYSRDVAVIRDDDMTLNIDGIYKVSFVSVAAVCQPTLINGFMTMTDVQRSAEKIRTMLRVAHLHHHKTLILGAFGCGAYGNPARQMAVIFRAVLNESEFHAAFVRIVFAILDRPYSLTNNYQTFKGVLETS